MDARQSHPFARPPERTLIHNPNHQSPPQPPQTQTQTQPFAGYPPATSQPQPPVHVPFSTDPYPSTRRDPFLPPTSQHVRRSSYGVVGAECTPQGERHGGWGNTGTQCGCALILEPSLRCNTRAIDVLDPTACLRYRRAAHVALQADVDGAKGPDLGTLDNGHCFSSLCCAGVRTLQQQQS